jgi:hypothetical protein
VYKSTKEAAIKAKNEVSEKIVASKISLKEGSDD